ncbi:hypothetical protein CRG98_047620, partial [Punica granatum]
TGRRRDVARWKEVECGEGGEFGGVEEADDGDIGSDWVGGGVLEVEGVGGARGGGRVRRREPMIRERASMNLKRQPPTSGCFVDTCGLGPNSGLESPLHHLFGW